MSRQGGRRAPREKGSQQRDLEDETKERKGKRLPRARRERGDEDSENSPPRRSGDKKMPPIFKAIAEDDLAEIELQLDKISLALPPIYKGCSPLSFGAKLGSLKVVKFLLQQGVPVDGSEMDTMTPLHHAVKRQHKEIVVALLVQHANIRGLSTHGKTAWEYARSDEMRSILRVHGSKSLPTPPSGNRRRSFDSNEERGSRSESWSGPRLNLEKKEEKKNPGGTQDRSASRPREHKKERSESRARRERQRKKKVNPENHVLQ